MEFFTDLVCPVEINYTKPPSMFRLDQKCVEFLEFTLAGDSPPRSDPTNSMDRKPCDGLGLWHARALLCTSTSTWNTVCCHPMSSKGLGQSDSMASWSKCSDMPAWGLPGAVNASQSEEAHLWLARSRRHAVPWDANLSIDRDRYNTNMKKLALSRKSLSAIFKHSGCESRV
eukprot:476902-Rhodomonas_salina.6